MEALIFYSDLALVPLGTWKLQLEPCDTQKFETCSLQLQRPKPKLL